MNNRLLGRLLAAGAVVMSGAMLLGTSPAGAATTGVGPQWYTTQGVQLIRSSGSETTYYLMARIGDLFTQTSIYGCTLSSTDERTCVTTADGTATDIVDDYSRVEVDNGAGVGSGTGIGQLCDIKPLGGAIQPDFARASRAAKSTENGGVCPSPTSPATNNGISYSGPVDLLYADDAVVGVDFPFNGATTETCATGSTCTATQIGPVADGWVPGNAFGGPYTNSPVTDIDNLQTETGGGVNTSILHRLQCGVGTANTDPKTNQIYDWGQLTDPTTTSDTETYTNAKGVSTTVSVTKGEEGLGTPIGVPIYVPFVNTASGTESSWQGFSGCANVNLDADGGNTVQENNAPQLFTIGLSGGSGVSGDATRPGTGAYLASHVSSESSALQTQEGTYFPASEPGTNKDNIYAENLVAATIYYMSYGVSNWEPHTLSSADVYPVGSAGTPNAGKRLTFNFVAASQTDENLSKCTLANHCGLIGSARQLHNYVNPEALRASTLDFMDWICNTDPSGTLHGTDLTTGLNYSTELTTAIQTTFFFPREDCSAASDALVPTDTST